MTFSLRRNTDLAMDLAMEEGVEVELQMLDIPIKVLLSTSYQIKQIADELCRLNEDVTENYITDFINSMIADNSIFIPIDTIEGKKRMLFNKDVLSIFLKNCVDLKMREPEVYALLQKHGVHYQKKTFRKRFKVGRCKNG